MTPVFMRRLDAVILLALVQIFLFFVAFLSGLGAGSNSVVYFFPAPILAGIVLFLPDAKFNHEENLIFRLHQSAKVLLMLSPFPIWFAHVQNSSFLFFNAIFFILAFVFLLHQLVGLMRFFTALTGPSWCAGAATALRFLLMSCSFFPLLGFAIGMIISILFRRFTLFDALSFFLHQSNYVYILGAFVLLPCFFTGVFFLVAQSRFSHLPLDFWCSVASPELESESLLQED